MSIERPYYSEIDADALQRGARVAAQDPYGMGVEERWWVIERYVSTNPDGTATVYCREALSGGKFGPTRLLALKWSLS